jgi:hypothetical protein
VQHTEISCSEASDAACVPCTFLEADDLVASIHVLARGNARCYLVLHALFSGEEKGDLSTVRTQHCRRFLVVVFQRQIQCRARLLS